MAREGSAAEHEEIIRTFVRGDAEAAARAGEANWRHSLERLELQRRVRTGEQGGTAGAERPGPGRDRGRDADRHTNRSMK